MKYATLTPFEIRGRHPQLNFDLYKDQRAEFINAINLGHLTAISFIKLSFSTKHYYRRPNELKPNQHTSRQYLTTAIRQTAKRLNIHLEAFAVFSPHKRNGADYPHMHLVLLTDAKPHETTRKEIHETLKAEWAEWGVLDVNKDCRRFDYLRLDECLAYMYSHDFHFAGFNLFCGRKEHGRGKRCPCSRKSRNRRSVA